MLVDVGAVDAFELFCRLLLEAGSDSWVLAVVAVAAEGASLNGRAADAVDCRSFDLSRDLNKPMLLFEFLFCNFAPIDTGQLYLLQNIYICGHECGDQ